MRVWGWESEEEGRGWMLLSHHCAQTYTAFHFTAQKKVSSLTAIAEIVRFS